MTSSPWPVGLLTALVTPMKDDKVHGAALGPVVDRQIGTGIRGLVVGGGTGEYGALTSDERQQLATEAIAAVGGRVPVVIQTGALTTRDAVTLSQHAEQAGAAAIMVASPFGEPINWRERLRFYEVLTAEISLPVMIYNTPPSGLLTFGQIRQLAELPHVSAVKDSSGNPELMGDLVEWAEGTDFAVYVGVDSLLYDAVRTGARGAVFGAANLIPGPLSAVARSLLRNGATAESAALWRQIRPFLRFMEKSPNYYSLCKAGLALQGFEVGDVRAPYLMPDAEEVKELGERLETVTRAFEESPLSVAL
jgi:4-hydroxy-tetrahydrodipicolinate synthase